MRRAGQLVWVALTLSVALSPIVWAAGAVRPPAGSKGYRLREYRWDAVLGQRWAVFEDARHPDWPLVSEIDSDALAGAVPANPKPLTSAPFSPTASVPHLVVHSGDTVTLWREDGNVRVELSAVAEGNAMLGGRVQLRVTGAGIFGNTGWRAAGVVRGPESVEME